MSSIEIASFVRIAPSAPAAILLYVVARETEAAPYGLYGKVWSAMSTNAWLGKTGLTADSFKRATRRLVEVGMVERRYRRAKDILLIRPTLEGHITTSASNCTA